MLPLLPRCRHPLRHGTLGQQHLLGALANRSTMVPLPASPPRRPFLQRPAQWRPQASSSLATTAPLPATNLMEKSTPVWLAIWHIWAGFANSQLLPDAAALSSMQGLSRSGNFSAQTSASLHPPASLRLRVLPFTRTWSSTVCAEEFPTPLEMSLHGLHLSTGLLLLRHSQICRPICTDCLRHLRISAG